jgi:hypothetical protein
MLRTTVVTAIAVLALAGEAAAGCFATLGMSVPRGVDAGERWTARLQVMQHGVRPVPDARPTVTITNAETGETRTFRARAAAEPGRYAATVVFPSRGAWRLSGNDGFDARDGSWRCSQNHTFGAVAIGPTPPNTAAPPGAPGEAPAPAPAKEGVSVGMWLALAGIGLAFAVLAGAALVGRPRRRVAA